MRRRLAALVLLVAPAASLACSFVQVLEAEEVVGAEAGPVDGAKPDVTFEAAAEAGLARCDESAGGPAQDTPLGSVLVLAWERVDGTFFVERGRAELSGERRSFRVTTAAFVPPAEARVAPSTPYAAIGHVYAVRPESTLAGLVDGKTLRAEISAGTYRDALVYVEATRPPDASVPSWLSRAPLGYSVWTCSGSISKNEAFTESRCDAMTLESAGDPTGDRHCDWH